MKTIFFLIFLGTGLQAVAKRLPPGPTKPLIRAGLRYEVVKWTSESPKGKQNGGIVRVVNTRDQSPICLRQVYVTKYDDNLEKDVQDNFITKLSAKGSDLIVESEKLPPISVPFANFCDQ